MFIVYCRPGIGGNEEQVKSATGRNSTTGYQSINQLINQSINNSSNHLINYL